MDSASTRWASLLSVLAAGAVLGVAFAAERMGGLAPCPLCLLERWPYRVAALLGIFALVSSYRISRLLLAALALVIFADAALAFVHVGVEAGAWPSPLPECSAPHLSGLSVAERLAQMPALPSKPCDAPSYLIPGLKVSMAAMNMVFALAFSAVLATFLWRSRSKKA
jgi:disulfide bond formation protein DsbB